MKKYFTDHDQHRFWKKNDIFGKKASQLAKRKKLTNFLLIYYVFIIGKLQVNTTGKSQWDFW